MAMRSSNVVCFYNPKDGKKQKLHGIKTCVIEINVDHTEVQANLTYSPGYEKSPKTLRVWHITSQEKTTIDAPAGATVVLLTDF